MFTGIVEGKGVVAGRTERSRGATLRIKPSFRLPLLKIGASIAVSGCCLTVARKGRGWFEADLSKETIRVTGLGRLVVGDQVNLERPLRLIDRLGGHIVQGHVDGVGKILAVEKNGKGSLIKIQLPQKLRRYLIPKGSVAVDGISMTVNGLGRDQFSLFVIPHTLKVTTLGRRRTGDPVNLEVDIIGKYLERLYGGLRRPLHGQSPMEPPPQRPFGPGWRGENTDGSSREQRYAPSNKARIRLCRSERINSK